MYFAFIIVYYVLQYCNMVRWTGGIEASCLGPLLPSVL